MFEAAGAYVAMAALKRSGIIAFMHGRLRFDRESSEDDDRTGVRAG